MLGMIFAGGIEDACDEFLLCKEIRDAGFEIGHHGYSHEWADPKYPERECEAFDRASEVLDRLLGCKPCGYRPPAAEITANTLKNGVRKLWDFDKPYRHPGQDLGTSTQIGISLGVALANRDKKRLVVDIQPAWLYLDTRTLTKQFGYDRLRYFQPLKSIFAAGSALIMPTGSMPDKSSGRVSFCASLITNSFAISAELSRKVCAPAAIKNGVRRRRLKH